MLGIIMRLKYKNKKDVRLKVIHYGQNISTQQS